MALLIRLLLSFQFILMACISTAFASPASLDSTQRRSKAQQNGNAEVLHQFGKGTYVENIAVRSNDKLLVVLLTAPEVWEVDPITHSMPRLVYKFPGFTRVTGIIETKPDVFAILSGKPPLDTLGGLWALWELDVGQPEAVARKVVAKISGAGILNGLTNLNKRAVLASDTAKGVVYRFDLQTGAQEVAIKGLGLGLNGVRIRDGFLYYSNTLKKGISKVKINIDTGETVGKTTIYGLDSGLGTDDFALSASGDAAYTCNQFSNELIKVDLTQENAKYVSIAGSKKSGLLLGPTSAVFGRMANTTNTIYVTTAGKSFVQLSTPKDHGNGGGKVVAVYL